MVSFMPVETGVSGAVELVVSDADTAQALRSGSVAVLGTPRIIALCEEATCQAVAGSLGENETTVGMRIEISHLAPTNVGSTVRAEATLEKTEGRRLTFTVSVSDDCGLVAAGKITRVVVDEKAFLEKAR
jgi:fluoroacetyl-CoA thioesterase